MLHRCQITSQAYTILRAILMYVEFSHSYS